MANERQADAIMRKVRPHKYPILKHPKQATLPRFLVSSWGSSKIQVFAQSGELLIKTGRNEGRAYVTALLDAGYTEEKVIEASNTERAIDQFKNDIPF